MSISLSGVPWLPVEDAAGDRVLNLPVEVMVPVCGSGETTTCFGLHFDRKDPELRKEFKQEFRCRPSIGRNMSGYPELSRWFA